MRLFRFILLIISIFVLITTLILVVQRRHHPDVMWIAFTRADETYNADDHGPSHLFRISPDGKDLQALTSTHVFGNSPLAWSPDGRRIVYTADLCQNSCYTPYTRTRQLHVLDDSPSVYSSAALYPQWSSDGEWLYYWSADTFTRRFYKMRPDGTQKVILATGISIAAAAPNDRDLAIVTAASSSRVGLYLLSDDGRQVRLLATGEPFFRDLSWSPNGHYLAFVNETETASFLVLVNLITGDSRALTRDYVHINPAPTWSPNSQYIVFSATQDRTNYELYRVAIADGREKQLTDTRLMAYSPRWSPNGEWISFIAEKRDSSVMTGVDSDLVLIRPDGSERRILPQTHGVVNLPTWSPLFDRPFSPLRVILPMGMLLAAVIFRSKLITVGISKFYATRINIPPR